MTSEWKPLRGAYGIAIHPFAPVTVQAEDDKEKTSAALQIPLEIGDDVYFFEQCGAWYRGFVVNAAAKVGIFPASFVHKRSVEGGDQDLPSSRITFHNSPNHRSEESASRMIRSPSPMSPEGISPVSLISPTERDQGWVDVGNVKSLPSLTTRTNINSLAPPDDLTAARRDSYQFATPHRFTRETASGIHEPLIDDIAAALREWLAHLYIYLRNQDYETYNSLKEHIRFLLQGRRQLLAQNLSQDGLVKLRKELVNKLSSGNRLQQLDVIVRHSELGYLADEETLSINQLYRMQLSLATNGTVTGETSNSNAISATSPSGSDPSSSIGKFYHMYLDIKAFVASVCAPGETTELYFSIYNKFSPITENFCLVLNSNGVLRDESGRMCTLFVDLSYSDMNENLWLVCSIIRNGKMKISDKASKESISTSPTSAGSFGALPINGKTPMSFRRPYGAAAIPIGDIAQGTNKDANAEQIMKIYLPKDENSFADLPQDIISGNSGKLQYDTARADMLAVRLKMFYGEVGHVIKENSALLSSIPLTSRIGFPDVVIPGDVRNVVYLTLVSGEFRKNTSVEVTVEIRHASGDPLRNVISRGAGEPESTWFDSMVLYHSNSPRWQESIKLDIPLDKFEKAHIFLTFRQCFAEKEDKGSFGFAYLPLVRGKSVVADGLHTLHLYKHDKSASEGSRIPDVNAYISDTGVPNNAETHTAGARPVPVILKDTCVIRTFLCSTKYTQSEQLLSLLNWKEAMRANNQAEQLLTSILNYVHYINELEVVKFLQDILDALFGIISLEINRKGQMDDLAFAALVFILGIVGDRRFMNFRSTLFSYIEKSFNWQHTAAHLIGPMRRLLADQRATGLRESIKVWEYLFSFIMQARVLQRETEAKSKDPMADANERHFKEELNMLLDSINGMMRLTQPKANIGIQTIALQHFPSILADLGKCFHPMELVQIAAAFTDAISFQRGKMTVYQTQLILNFTRGPLFDNFEARRELTKAIVRWVTDFVQPWKDCNDHNQWCETLRSCATLLSEYLEKLQRIVLAAGNHGDDEERQNVLVVLSLLPALLTAYRGVLGTAAEGPIGLPLVAVSVQEARDMSSPAGVPITEQLLRNVNATKAEIATTVVALLLLVSEQQFGKLLRSIHNTRTSEGSSEFLISLHTVFSSLLTDQAYPAGWLNMIQLTHKTVFKTLHPVAAFMLAEFVPNTSEEFDTPLWSSFFEVMHALIASRHLQLENFGPQKRRAVANLTGDLRDEAVRLLLTMWNNLGSQNESKPNHQHQFETTMIGKFLELSMSGHEIVRKCAVQLLFDMVRNRYTKSSSFGDIESDFIDKLDRLVMSDMKGDDRTRQMLNTELRRKFEDKSIDDGLRKAGCTFLDSLNQFFTLLLNVRCLPESEEFEEERMVGTLKLMQFIRHIDRDEVYVKYVHQLVQMQLKSENFLEAGLTLRLHSDLLEWNLEKQEKALPEIGLPAQSAFDRKEYLLLKILNHFNEGKGWELGIDICKDLVNQYTSFYRYQRVGEVLQQEAVLYTNVVTKERYQREYFRVGYYGRGFPSTLRDKQFIYRGDEWEKIGAFCERIQNRHPLAQLLKSNSVPADEILNSEGQHLQITAVAPEPDRGQDVFVKGDLVPDPIRAYFEVNQVNTFSFSRPFRKASKTGNEFLDLWTEKTVLHSVDTFPSLLRRSEVKKSVTVEISPIENAVFAMAAKNKELRNLAKKYGAAATAVATATAPSTKMNVNPLTMSLNGAVDAPVNGGVPMYKQAFFDPKYLELNPEKGELVTQLREAINEQVKIIDECLEIHDVIVPPEMRPLHENLMQFFKKNFVEEISRMPAKSEKRFAPAASQSKAGRAVPAAPAGPAPPSGQPPTPPAFFPQLTINSSTYSNTISPSPSSYGGYSSISGSSGKYPKRDWMRAPSPTSSVGSPTTGLPSSAGSAFLKRFTTVRQKGR